MSQDFVSTSQAFSHLSVLKCLWAGSILNITKLSHGRPLFLHITQLGDAEAGYLIQVLRFQLWHHCPLFFIGGLLPCTGDSTLFRCFLQRSNEVYLCWVPYPDVFWGQQTHLKTSQRSKLVHHLSSGSEWHLFSSGGQWERGFSLFSGTQSLIRRTRLVSVESELKIHQTK